MLHLFSLYCVVTCLAGASLTAELPPDETVQTRSGIVLVDDFQLIPLTEEMLKQGEFSLESPSTLKLTEAPAPIPAGSSPYQYSAPPQPQTPPALTSTEHLREAVRHLREAGFGEDADRIQRQADELKEMKRLELAEKKKQIDELQAHVAQLELELGTASQYIIEVTMGEMDLKKFRGMGISWDTVLNGESTTATANEERKFIPTGIVDSRKFSIALQALESNGTLKILSDSRMATGADQPVAYHSGEEVEVVQQTAGDSTVVSRRPLGEMLFATVTPLGDDLVRLKFTANFSRLGAQVDLTEGKQTPQIQSRTLQTTVELKSDQTIVLVTTPQSESNEVVGFTALKVSPIRPMSSRSAAPEAP